MKKPISEIVVAKDVQQAQLALGFRTFGVEDPRRYALTVLDAIMGRGMSSRLFVELREKRGISYDISSRVQFFAGYGMWTVTAGVDVAKRQQALAAIEREIEKIRTKKVPERELRRIKEFLVGNFRLGHEKLTNKLFFYGSTLMAFGRLVLPQEQIDGVRAVTSGDILAVAQEVLVEEHKAISWVIPK